MKKVIALALACSTLAGCHYLGEPEAYTVVEEDTAPIATPAPVAQPVVPVVQPVAPCGCGMVNGVQRSACQVNPGVAGPLVITIPSSTVCVR